MDLVEARLQGHTAAVRHPWERARFEVVKTQVARRVPLADGAVVLDVGCGDSFVVDRFAHVYPAVEFHGVDTAFTQETIHRYRRQSTASNVHLHQSLDEIVLPPGRTARLVLLMDVLEHVEHEESLLRSLFDRPYIDGETWFLVTVPAYQWLFSAHDRFLGHYRRYTRASARRRFSSAGLSLVDSGYFFASLVPIRAVQLLFERLRSAPRDESQTGVAGWQGRTVLANALTALLVFDDRVGRALSTIGISLPGLSVFALCRKSA